MTIKNMVNMRLILVAITLLLLVIIIVVLIRRPVTNYPEKDFPLFSANYAEEQPAFDGIVKVITWNIAFSKDIEAAIQTFRRNEALKGGDVILLQEMDETGTHAIASALNYNYVYYPASIHSSHGQNFGNAVLSKWPILESKKLILPHKNPSNRQIRIAVRALLALGHRELSVYSIHTETPWLGAQGRNDQYDALARNYVDDIPFLIAGGDFNTFTQASLESLDQRLGQVDLVRVSEGAGTTRSFGPLGLILDHIYARNMPAIATGVADNATGSDHYPVWVELSLLDGAMP